MTPTTVEQSPKYLGQSSAEPWDGFDTFPKPERLDEVKMVSDEFTAICPVTGQPDQYTVTIEYAPAKSCLESKSLKLYLQRYRNQGVYCEALAAEIAETIHTALHSYNCRVTLKQKARGGIEITARAVAYRDFITEDLEQDSEAIDGDD